MPLILQPTFSDKSREEIEQHLLVVRSRRMAAVVTYYAGVNAKTLHGVAKEQGRIAREYEMLRRDINRMNKLEEAIEKRLITLEQHQQQLDMYRGNLVEIDDGSGTEKGRDEGKRNEQSESSRRRGTNGEYRGAVRSGRPPGS